MSGLVYLMTGTFIEHGRDLIASLRAGGGGVDGPEAVPAVAPIDALDASEAAFAGSAHSSGGRGGGGGKDEGGLTAPLLGGGSGASASDLASLHASVASGRPSEAISIGHRRSGSNEAVVVGSVGRSHPYERGSFSMLINTPGFAPHGSYTAAGHLGAALHMATSPQQQHEEDEP